MRYVFLFVLSIIGHVANAQLTLLPKNPHYFSYRGKPTVLIGSSEHYGVVINTEFNIPKYMDAEAAAGLNLIRVFMGSYCEKPGAFGIEKNNLAPKSASFLAPWKRSNVPGYANGGNKFDLEQWDEAYFVRLKEMVTQAQKRNIIVEITLFSSYYGAQWDNSPLNAKNNVNNVGDVPFNRANTLENGTLLAFQGRMVRKIVRELNRFDNVYYEIQNEPWADNTDSLATLNDYLLRDELKEGGNFWKNRVEPANGLSLKWQARIAEYIADEEKSLPNRHLISQNYGNFSYAVPEVNQHISILNFHYALPSVVADNLHFNKVIGFNETGFAGRNDQTYRRQLWRFMMAGGGLFTHLDYSFSVGYEDGTDLNYAAPGGGSPALRKQFGSCKSYFEQLNLSSLRPDHSVIRAAPGCASPLALTAGSTQVVVYIEPLKATSITLNLPNGTYQTQWFSPTTGTTKALSLTVQNGAAVVPVPNCCGGEWVLKLDKK
jgi:Cellulase (glycosyl hydrolase family 5)